MFRANLFLVSVFAFVNAVTAQKSYNDGIVTYNIVVSTGSKETKAADLMDGAVQKVIFKGTQTRTELKSILGTTVTLHDTRSGAAVILNDYGDQKILIRLAKADYEDRNKKYAGMKFELKNDTKKILGYTCNLAVATLKDGSTFKVYYTTDLVFQNKDYGMQFQSLPGFPLEYESELGSLKVTYVADKISFEPVTAALFDIPKTGYREMSYEEVKKAQGKN